MPPVLTPKLTKIEPLNGYVNSSGEFVLIIGYGGQLLTSSTATASAQVQVEDASGQVVDVQMVMLWELGSPTTAIAGMQANVLQRRMLVPPGFKVVSSPGGGTDFAMALVGSLDDLAGYF